jgi:hypothetical protein
MVLTITVADIIAEFIVNPLKARIIAAFLQNDKLAPETFYLLFSKQDQRIIKTWVLRHKGRCIVPENVGLWISEKDGKIRHVPRGQERVKLNSL